MSFTSHLALIRELSNVGRGYIPSTLVKLTLSAEPIPYNATSAIVHYKAVTNGTDANGTALTYVVDEGDFTYPSSGAIPMNNTAHDVEVSVTFQYQYEGADHQMHDLGDPVTSTIIQKAKDFHISYKIHLDSAASVQIYNSQYNDDPITAPSSLWINGESVETISNIQSLDAGDTSIQLAFAAVNDKIVLPDYLLAGLTSIKEVEITDLTDEVGDGALYGCTGITNVNFGNTLTKIGENAFYGCTGITEVHLPSSLELGTGGSVGADAFKNCSNIVRVFYNGTADGWCKITFGNAYANPITIGKNFYLGNSLIKFLSLNVPVKGYAFSGAECLRIITFGSGVTRIGTMAFAGCSNINTVNMGINIANYDSKCFMGCSAIKILNLSDGTLNIYSEAFKDCSNLHTVILPAITQTLGDNVFNGCEKLARVRSLNLTAPTVTNDTFGTAGSMVSSKKLEILKGATGYDSNSSAWKTKLCDESYNNFVLSTVPYVTCEYNISAEDAGVTAKRVLGASLSSNTIDTILLSYNDANSNNALVTRHIDYPTNGMYTFLHSGTNIITIIFSSATIVPNGAFVEIEAAKVKVGNGIVSVGGSAFYQAEITEFETSPTVTSIGDGAVSSCNNLESVVLAEGLQSIGNSAFFNDSNLLSVDIPSTVTSIGNSAFRGCGSLTSINVDTYNTVYMSDDGVLFRLNPRTLIQFPGGKSTGTSEESGHYTVPQDASLLGEMCFSGCTKVRVIDLSLTSITQIPNYAFNNCADDTDGLTSIVLRNEITSIGQWAFNGCRYLSGITFPSGLQSIGGYAFYSCSALEGITIPTGVTYVGTSAFAGTGITSVIWNATSCTTGISTSTSSLSGAPFSNTLTSIVFGNNVTNIPAGICYGQTHISSLAIPPNVVSIGQFAFAGFNGAFSSFIPASVTSIGSYAFNGCTLPSTQITLPSGLLSIESFAFNNCKVVTSIDVASTVLNSVGEGGFANIATLTDITFRKDDASHIPTLGASAFHNNSHLTAIYVPSDVVNNYKAAPIWSQYAGLITAIQQNS